MSSEQQTLSSDFRSSAQDYKRDATRKHKWALGGYESVGRAPGSFRPNRPTETDFAMRRRANKAAVASLHHTARISRKHDLLEGATNALADLDPLPSPPAISPAVSVASSLVAPSDSPLAAAPAVSPAALDPANITYSFDAARGPSHGSQILNVALAKAVERFEEKETLKLVRTEYDVLDTQGESISVGAKGKAARHGGGAVGGGATTMKKTGVVDVDEDYEFV